jgi:hypothetical protein
MRVRPPQPLVPEEVRRTWDDLAARYRWLYGMTLQERLDQPLIRADVNGWWRVGGRRDPAPTHFG